MRTIHHLVDGCCFALGLLYYRGSSHQDKKAGRRKEGHENELLAASRGRIAAPRSAATVDALLAWRVLRLAHRCYRLSFHVGLCDRSAKPDALCALAGAGKLV